MLQEILKTAMLGTEKVLPSADTQLLQEVAGKIAATKEDKEDAFLKITAAYLLLQEAGKQLPVNDFQHTKAPEDQKALINADAAGQIHQLIQVKDDKLLAYALYRCNVKNKAVRHDLVPALLNLAAANKEKQPYLMACGERGRWLASLNERWHTLYAPAEADVWETGTFPQRLEFLKAFRKKDPQQARALLEETLAKENANTRNELLEAMIVGLSTQDEPFLLSQCKDKSQKVKQTAYTLLKLLPESTLSRQYQQFLKETLQLKEERVMLLAKKKRFEINLNAAYPQHLADSGLDKVSSQKGVEDEAYWVAQSIQHLHPRIWQESWGISPEQTVQLFAAHKHKELFMQALIEAAFLYQHQALAAAILKNKLAPNPQLLQVLPLQERWAFADPFMEDKSNAALLLPLLMDGTYTPIPAAICRQLLRLFSREPYAVSQSLYHQWALYMPPQLLPELEGLAGREVQEYQQRFFKNVALEMTRIIENKEQLNASI